MEKTEILIGRLAGKIDEGFSNIYRRLEAIDSRLSCIEKNNTQQKLRIQKNSNDIEVMNSRFQEYIVASKNNEKLNIDKAQLKYSKWKIIISILEVIGTFGLGYFIRDIIVRFF